MSRNSNAIIAVSAFLLVSLGLIGSILYRLLTSDVSEETYQVMMAEPFSCQGEQQVVVAEWENSGWIRYCVLGKTKEGPTETWVAARISSRGQFKNNARFGHWHYFDSDGKVVETKVF